MPTVLLVDDSATIRMSLDVVLTRKGFDVVTADGAAAALEDLRIHRPDVIITDLNMPEMDGIEFIRAVRQLPEHRFTPVLLLTNESERAKREAAKAAGATGWLVKPVGAEALVEVLNSVLPVRQ